MRTKGIVFGILALFTVIALSATGAYAEEHEKSIAAVSSTGTLDGSGFGITDDFAVADGCEEIKYDDNSAEDSLAWVNPGPWGPCMAVHFTMPAGYTTLKTARFPIGVNDSAPNNSFGWKVLEWTGTAPGSVIASGTITPINTGWYDVDVSGITVSDDFVIAMHWEHGCAPFLFIDTNSTAGRSWHYPGLAEGGEWTAESRFNYMIRAVVCSDVEDPDINVTLVEIENATAPAEGTVKVPIRIADVTDLCGANIWLYYDISVVTVGEVEINDPDPENGASSIDNETGIAKMVWDTTDGKTDDFVFAYVTLNAVGAEGDKCTLDLKVKELYGCDVGMTDIEYTVQNGTFEVNGTGRACGDVDTHEGLDGRDVAYLAKHVAKINGYDTLYGDGDVDTHEGLDGRDVAYLAKHVAKINGYDTLHC